MRLVMKESGMINFCLNLKIARTHLAKDRSGAFGLIGVLAASIIVFMTFDKDPQCSLVAL
jgi:hypothetical protein